MKNNKVIIIAEAGVNHNGDINLAKRLVDLADQAGADYIKFQTWITEDLINKDAPKAIYQKKNDASGDSQYEMLKKLELSYDDFRELKKYCDNLRIDFLSTPDEEGSLNFLVDELLLDVIKVGSGEITNIPFLRAVATKQKDVILSTGMANIGEVERAVRELSVWGANSVSLLHCTSNYPAPYSSVNLKAMNTMGNTFKLPIGYSDHTEGISVSLAAVALGAEIIEKHFTLDKSMSGPDHVASLSPLELKNLVNEVRIVEEAILGSGKKEIQDFEIETKSVLAKGLYIKSEITKGSVISSNSIIAKRPVNGISVSEFDYCIGKKVNKNKFQGESLLWEDICFE